MFAGVTAGAAAAGVAGAAAAAGVAGVAEARAAVGWEMFMPGGSFGGGTEEPDAASNAFANSVALGKRSAGSFAIARRSTSPTAVGTWGASASMGCGAL